ncbi:MAG: MvdC/MvdD family ATP grasp protein [Candidatus Levyibacteriota bacterium]
MILIASHTEETAVTQPVVDLLRAKGERVLVYEADKVASGEVRVDIKVGHDARVTLRYGENEFSPDDIKAAWYRRPNVFGPEELNNVLLIYLDRQRKACQDSFWYSIPPERWLNAPEKLESAAYQDKLLQLRLAHKYGFATPQTVVTNSWEEAYNSFDMNEVIIKLPNGRLYVDQEAHFLVSTIIDRRKQNKLKHTIPFPGIWQEYISKKREWRITVVGDNVFPVAIYTSNKARADWRKHQFDKRTVRFRAEQLSDEVGRKCVDMLHGMGLRFGAFDFIEDKDGTFIFLEVNLNGQYHWLVDELHLPIPEAIAEELLKIKAVGK